MRLRNLAVLTAAAAILLASTSVASAKAQAATVAQASQPVQSAKPKIPSNASWTTYHHDNSRAGYDAGEPTFSNLAPAWQKTTLVGDIYASPLVYGSIVYVATEDNYIYALDAATGVEQWHVQLSTPESSSSLPCGNISPHVGITSTPVI